MLEHPKARYTANTFLYVSAQAVTMIFDVTMGDQQETNSTIFVLSRFLRDYTRWHLTLMKGEDIVRTVGKLAAAPQGYVQDCYNQLTNSQHLFQL